MRHAPRVFLSTVFATCVAAGPNVACAEDLPMVDGLPGGNAESRTCPDEAVMTGLRVRFGIMLDAIGIRCRRINANGTLGSEFDDGSMMGGTGGTVRVTSCPSGTVIVGQRLVRSLVPPFGLVQVGFTCRGWSPTLRTTYGATAVVVVWKSNLSAHGTSDDCSAPSRPVRRVRTRAGIYVNAAGFTCLST